MARAKPQEKFSIAEMKRKQFAQRSMWYSEPVRDELLDDPALGMDFDDEDEDYGDDDCFCKEEESVSRSRGCVERISTRSDSGIHTSRTSSSSSYCSNASNSSDKLNRKEPVPGSILKKNYSDCSVREPEESLNTTTNSSPPLTPCGLKKQTSFKEEVDIYRYDKRDVPASAASTSKDSQKLKDNSHLAVEGKLQVPEQHACEHTTTKEEDSTESSSKDDVTAGDPQCSAKDSPKEEKTPRRTSSGSGSGSMFRARKIELLTEIEGACDSMRLILCLSDGYVKSRTTVKALSGGYSLIVSSEQQRGAQENHDGDKDEANYSEERINLPLKVDPYSVKAFMHTSGSLIIDAPIAWDGVWNVMTLQQRWINVADVDSSL